MENRTILIMMATYNGEKYISKQLETIINQTYTNWELIIRDDCSTDNTLGIIKDYVKKDSRIKYILSDSKKHGAYYNFFGLINYAKTLEKYDFYMFADQDDEWDSTKLEEYLKFYNEKNTSQRPTLVYGNMRIIDAHGQVTSENMDNLTGIGYTNVMTSFFAHKVYGCTIFFNFDLLKSLPVIENNDEVLGYLSHDNFVTKWAGIFGKVYYLPLTTMGYRRYNENVTSKHSYDYGFKRIFRRIFKINELNNLENIDGDIEFKNFSVKFDNKILYKNLFHIYRYNTKPYLIHKFITNFSPRNKNLIFLNNHRLY